VGSSDLDLVPALFEGFNLWESGMIEMMEMTSNKLILLHEILQTCQGKVLVSIEDHMKYLEYISSLMLTRY